MHTPSLSDLLQFAIQPAECALSWLRVMDSNHRPLAYEANSLTSDVTRDKTWYSQRGSNPCFRLERAASLPLDDGSKYGAGNEDRTRDLMVGNQPLYP